MRSPSETSWSDWNSLLSDRRPLRRGEARIRAPPNTQMRTICCHLEIESACALLLAASALAQNKPIILSVDATDAPRKILHARLRIPAQSGPLTLRYPKWLPGEHSPSGPIAALVALTMSSAGRSVPWRPAADATVPFQVDPPPGG